MTEKHRPVDTKGMIEAAAAADLPPPPDPEAVALRMQGAQVVLEPDSAARAGAMGIYPEVEQNRVLRDAGLVQMGLDPQDPSNELTDPEVPPAPPTGGNGGTGGATSAPVNVDVPFVQQAGATATCTMGNWEGEPTSYTYQWQMDGANIPGDGASLPLTSADLGHSVACVVTATNAHGSTAAPPSNAVVVA
jgi:hypothetical protein